MGSNIFIKIRGFLYGKPFAPSGRVWEQQQKDKEKNMSTHKGRILMVAVLIAVAISAPSFLAQSPRMSATIPFDFYISDRLFPAGTYTVAPQSNAVRLYDGRGNSVFVMTPGSSDNRAMNDSRLVFRTYGDASFLASIYWAGYKAGRDLPSSKIEKKIAGNLPAFSPVAVQLK